MANLLQRRLITPRDLEILTAISRSPLTSEQLLKLSTTFQQPFTSVRRVRERMHELDAAWWVKKSLYATATSGGSPAYYQLTLTGYRILYGHDAKPQTKRYFDEISISHQHHTRCLADFVVHTIVCAHHHGIRMTDFRAENTVRFTVGDESVLPDCAFRLIAPGSDPYNFVVELDNSTETVRSQRNTDSWERRIQLYDQFQDVCERRFRVLVVTTRSRERLDHILEAARALQRNPRRSLFYGVYLPDYLEQSDAIRSACFLNHRGRPTAMVPKTAKFRATPSASQILVPAIS